MKALLPGFPDANQVFIPFQHTPQGFTAEYEVNGHAVKFIFIWRLPEFEIIFVKFHNSLQKNKGRKIGAEFFPGGDVDMKSPAAFALPFSRGGFKIYLS